MAAPDRRRVLAGGAASLAVLAAGRAASQEAPAQPLADPAPADLALVARRGLERFGAAAGRRDLVAVADFGLPSWRPRLSLVDMVGGAVRPLLVAHGCGSDPNFTGWLESFSNVVGSQASCEGAFRTLGRYRGVHGLSMRLAGLEAGNSNAARRHIVVHAADYVSAEEVRDIGMVGWSEGCFAIDRRDLGLVLERLSPGHLLISAKVARPPAPAA